MTSIKDLQIFHRSLSDAFDARSEAARKSLETSKRNALAMPEREIVEELIEGLGKATTDAERVRVVSRLKTNLQKPRRERLRKQMARRLTPCCRILSTSISMKRCGTFTNRLPTHSGKRRRIRSLVPLWKC